MVDMQATIELITRQSKSKVNNLKTEICIIHRKDHPPIILTQKQHTNQNKKQMKVLDITFNSKLQWQNQTQNAIMKSKMAPGAICSIC